METKTTIAQAADAALPTSFVSADESAELTKMLELEFEQAQQVAGGLACGCCCHRCCHAAN